MPMADHQGHGKSWKPNHYILAALGGTLAVAVVVTITSLILSPAQVTFSVTHASRRTYDENGNVNLTVTVAAYNPSHRCKVSYRSVFIDLKNSSTAAGKSLIHANADKIFPIDYVLGPHVTQITASVQIVNENDNAYFASRLNRTGLTVLVKAQVRFKIGVTPTRRYGIRVSCPNVRFLDFNSSTANQSYINCSG